MSERIPWWQEGKVVRSLLWREAVFRRSCVACAYVDYVTRRDSPRSEKACKCTGEPLATFA